FHEAFLGHPPGHTGRGENAVPVVRTKIGGSIPPYGGREQVPFVEGIVQPAKNGEQGALASHTAGRGVARRTEVVIVLVAQDKEIITATAQLPVIGLHRLGPCQEGKLVLVVEGRLVGG